ncbi:MAG: lipase, partial [Frankiales bacterium]|nr:lipase [Frankiales bacterium]
MTLRPALDRGAIAGGNDVTLPGQGVTLAATLWAGSGRPVVLLHGLASQRRFWDLVVRRLAGLPVLALDARGHGDSDQPEAGYDLETVAADVVAATRAAGIERACVVGHSWGGAVALTMAARHPELVEAVVAIDGGFVQPGQDEPRHEIRRRLEPPRFAVPVADLPAMLRQGAMGPYWSPEVEAAVLPIFGVDDDGLARARLPFERHMDVVDGLLDVDLESSACTNTLPIHRLALPDGEAVEA